MDPVKKKFCEAVDQIKGQDVDSALQVYNQFVEEGAPQAIAQLVSLPKLVNTWMLNQSCLTLHSVVSDRKSIFTNCENFL